jgi:hypothetical protein
LAPEQQQGWRRWPAYATQRLPGSGVAARRGWERRRTA